MTTFPPPPELLILSHCRKLIPAMKMTTAEAMLNVYHLPRHQRRPASIPRSKEICKFDPPSKTPSPHCTPSGTKIRYDVVWGHLILWLAGLILPTHVVAMNEETGQHVHCSRCLEKLQISARIISYLLLRGVNRFR